MDKELIVLSELLGSEHRRHHRCEEPIVFVETAMSTAVLVDSSL